MTEAKSSLTLTQALRRQEDAERPERHARSVAQWSKLQHEVEVIVPYAPRGNAGLDALRRQEDAERPERHDDAERRTMVKLQNEVEVIVPYAPRGNAGLDALRRKRTRSVPNGMRRGATHDGQSFSTKLRLSFPRSAWECRSRRSASHNNCSSTQPQRPVFFRPMTCENTACKSSEALSWSRLSLPSMWSM